MQPIQGKAANLATLVVNRRWTKFCRRRRKLRNKPSSDKQVVGPFSCHWRAGFR